jgi:DNA invertase Pin-like site-specific DNA recombinase
MLYGYARVSSIDQDLALQRAALKAAGCHVIRAEKASGTRRNGRTELQTLLEFLRGATHWWSPASTAWRAP